ncbi:unnamed protein product [Allacma fusca]|uniref:Uncharacterized protein n=1 Tax=Allacma fusca TaxID=39272 RepID=A0A8J2NQ96_9HEXA|nr:unnamed protein product [Allacma fusca]
MTPPQLILLLLFAIFSWMITARIHTFQQLTNDAVDPITQTAQVLKRDLYVEDCLSGSNTIMEVAQLCQDLMCQASGANFTLRKWSTSHSEVRTPIPRSERLRWHLP